MSSVRSFGLHLAAITAGLLVLTQPATAQLSVSGACLDGEVSCSLFEFMLEGDRPFALASAEFTFLSPDWSFSSPFYQAEDQFGPFAGVGAVVDGSTLFLDFLDSPGFPLEFLDPFPGLVTAEVSGKGEARFAWTATEIDGSAASGTYGSARALPEPGTLLLLAAGLAGLVAVRRREVTL